MKNLLVIREQIKMIYSRFEYIITPVYKFLLSFISLSVINSKLGYFGKIDSVPIVIVAALFCSFMPTSMILVISSVFIMLHVYQLSMAAAIVMVIILLLMFLLYFRFSPGNTAYVVLTPLLFLLKIPYVLPIACGLLCGPVAAISVAVGTIIYFAVRFIKTNEVVLSAAGEDALVVQFKMIIDGIVKNQEMYVWILASCLTIVLVYLIRRLAINHAWMIAMAAGAIMNIVILLMGALLFDFSVSIFGVFFGTILALGIAKIIEFFRFNVDYKRIEYVQYEDDEYYYYVKAVPKNVVAKPEKSVKKVSSSLSDTRPMEKLTMDTFSKSEKDSTPTRSRSSVSSDMSVNRTVGSTQTRSRSSISSDLSANRTAGSTQTRSRSNISADLSANRTVGSTQTRNRSSISSNLSANRTAGSAQTRSRSNISSDLSANRTTGSTSTRSRSGASSDLFTNRTTD